MLGTRLAVGILCIGWLSIEAADLRAFEGTWKLNVGTSVFHNGASQNGIETLKATADRLDITRVWTTAGGEHKELNLTCLFDAKNRPISWTADATHRSHTIRSKRLAARSFAITITHDEGEETSVIVHELSADANTMTVTTTALHDDGRSWKDVFYYERR